MKMDVEICYNLDIVCLYVNDLLITRKNHNEIENLKLCMSIEFNMIDLRGLNYCFGLEFTVTMKDLVIHQRRYIYGILKIFDIMKCNSTNTLMETNLKLSKDEDAKTVGSTLYKQMVGGSRYACNSNPIYVTM